MRLARPERFPGRSPACCLHAQHRYQLTTPARNPGDYSLALCWFLEEFPAELCPCRLGIVNRSTNHLPAEDGLQQYESSSQDFDR